MKNNSDYYVSWDLSRKLKDPEISRYQRYESSLNENDDLDWIYDETTLSDEDGENCDLDDNEIDPLDDVVWPPIQPTKHISALEKSIDCADLAASSTLNTTTSFGDISMTIEDVELSLRSQNSTESDDNFATRRSTLSSDFPDLPTCVQLLQHSLEQMDSSAQVGNHDSRLETTQDPQKCTKKPSLDQVSSTLLLNEKQNKMFVNVGKKLITSLLLGHNADEQIIEFLGGKTGAGKSRVIGALQILAEKWRCPKSVATAAYQGVAAQAANGQTIHNLFGWYVNNTRKWAPTQGQKERFANLKLLIIDEVFNRDYSILGKNESSPRELLSTPSKVFGGIHVLLVGDWLQQFPVAGQPAFLATDKVLSSRGQHQETVDYLDRVRGFEAYRSVNSVVIFTENMRHRDDPVWKSILDKWRVGNYDDADIELVNKIAHDESWESRNGDSKSYCPIIVTSNALRVEFNNLVLRSFCSKAKVPLHQFPAAVKRLRHRLTQTQRKSLDCVRDDKTGGMSTVLEIAIESMGQCTKNLSSYLKLANGSIGTVIGFTPAQTDEVQVHVVNDIKEHHHSLPPDVDFCEIKGLFDYFLSSRPSRWRSS